MWKHTVGGSGTEVGSFGSPLIGLAECGTENVQMRVTAASARRRCRPQRGEMEQDGYKTASKKQQSRHT